MLLNRNSRDNSLMNYSIDVGGVVIDRYIGVLMAIINGGDRSSGIDVCVKEWYLESLPHTHMTRLAFFENNIM